MSNFTYSDELYHYGTKGMRWGFRRYQYLDGKLTPEGYEHYGKKPRELRAEASHYRARSAELDRASRRRFFPTDRDKAERRMSKLDYKAAKLEKRAADIEKDEAEALETAAELNRRYANELAVAREIETSKEYMSTNDFDAIPDRTGTANSAIKNSETIRRMAQELRLKHSKEISKINKSLNIVESYKGPSDQFDAYLKDPNNKAIAKEYNDGKKAFAKYEIDVKHTTQKMVLALGDFGIIDKDATSEASTANLVRSMLSYEPALKKLRQ